MSFVDVITRKRDGRVLSREEIEGFVTGVTRQTIPDYQAAALLMAIVLRGMTDEETSWLTDAMARSGARIDLSDIPGVKIGKHSTGGVGDKVSIVLAPLAAACGVVAPKMSGRGLGHTGGTLDKLESIAGYRIDLGIAEFKRVLREVGASIIGQSAAVAPADKKLYALRDVTATIESIPLLASSIMSKKLAEGSDALVLDVKCGDGAFMKDVAGARALAETMVRMGTRSGLRTEAVITDMSSPLGNAVGNAIEIIECIDCLMQRGPADVTDIVVRLAARMVVLAGVEVDPAAAAARVRAALESGRAAERFTRMIEAHGGDPRVVEDPSRLPAAPGREVLCAGRSGYIGRLAAEGIGRASHSLGAGRDTATDTIDHAVGVKLLVHVGDPVDANQPIVELHHRDGRGLAAALEQCRSAVTLADAPPPARAKVIGEVC